MVSTICFLAKHSSLGVCECKFKFSLKELKKNYVLIIFIKLLSIVNYFFVLQYLIKIFSLLDYNVNFQVKYQMSYKK